MEGAILFYPKTQYEADAVISFWKSDQSNTKTDPRKTWVFVGISDIITEGVFLTVDGKTEVYINWIPGEPNNHLNEDCVMMNQEGFFNDRKCEDKEKFICKKSAVSSLERDCSTSSNIQPCNLCPRISLNIVLWPNTTVPFSTDCEQKKQDFFREDYTYIETEKSFYKYHTQLMNWHNAKEVCALEGAGLFYPENKDEADTVISFWKLSQNDNTSPSITWIYLGISDIKTEGVFVTIDGRTDMYLNWREGQPDNWKGDEDCVQMNQDGFYNDINCEKKFNFICKKSLTLLRQHIKNGTYPETKKNRVRTGDLRLERNSFSDGTYPETRKNRVRSGDLRLERNSSADISLKTFVFWPNATVPFYIHPDHFDNEQASVILKSLAMFGFKTCIKFASITSAPSEGQHVMTFINPEGVRRCTIETKGHSNYNPHLILLGYECLNTRQLDMIIMRALGLPFEHNRANRDVYIDVLIENIEPNYMQLFTKDSILPRPLRDIPYDHNSIMHFGERDYSKNGHVTIKFKYRRFRQDRNGLTPGDIQRSGLTPTDIIRIALIYGPECRMRDRLV